MSLKNWSIKLGIKYHTLYNRITKLGWDIETALSLVPYKHEKNL